MLISKRFQSRFLKAEDLNGKPRKYEIVDCRDEHIGDDDEKPVVFFKGTPKGLVLNKTNAEILKEACGDETDGWVGKIVILRPDKTPFNGKVVPCIRVQAVSPVLEEEAPF